MESLSTEGGQLWSSDTIWMRFSWMENLSLFHCSWERMVCVQIWESYQKLLFRGLKIDSGQLEIIHFNMWPNLEHRDQICDSQHGLNLQKSPTMFIGNSISFPNMLELQIWASHQGIKGGGFIYHHLLILMSFQTWLTFFCRAQNEWTSVGECILTLTDHYHFLSVHKFFNKECTIYSYHIRYLQIIVLAYRSYPFFHTVHYNVLLAAFKKTDF